MSKTLQTNMNGPNYVELCVTTNFTFLTGASHPEELMTRAAELGLAAIAITDRNSLAGVVRAYSALKELKREAEGRIRLPKLIVGCRLVLTDSSVEWVALPCDRDGYARLSRLLTLGKRRAEKGECHLKIAGFMIVWLIALPQGFGPACAVDHWVASIRQTPQLHACLHSLRFSRCAAGPKQTLFKWGLIRLLCGAVLNAILAQHFCNLRANGGCRWGCAR